MGCLLCSFYDVLQERKESISNYLNLFLSILIYPYLSESISILNQFLPDTIILQAGAELGSTLVRFLLS